MSASSSGERRQRTTQKALSDLEGPRRSAVERRAKDMPSLYRGGYLKAVTGRASPREAIKAHCLECMGYSYGEVARCSPGACPLYAYRPPRS